MIITKKQIYLYIKMNHEQKIEISKLKFAKKID